ncbi:MAG: HEPN domain-containing protein [Bacillota bacterium]
MGKAEESLKSARSELEAGRLSFAVNRLYYVLFYLVTAALSARGENLASTPQCVQPSTESSSAPAKLINRTAGYTMNYSIPVIRQITFPWPNSTKP